jgi:hypothetical protein
MNSKAARYRQLVQALAKLGDEQATGITTNRYKLMYHYFVRCVGLCSAVILLVEQGYLAAAFALQKSILDAMLNGLYLGYVASEREINEAIALALRGRCTGHSGMRKRAKLIDSAIRKRFPLTSCDLQGMVRKSEERLNEFGHGGLLSTALNVRDLVPEVGNKALADGAAILIIFISQIFLLEVIDTAPLSAIMRQFDETR